MAVDSDWEKVFAMGETYYMETVPNILLSGNLVQMKTWKTCILIYSEEEGFICIAVPVLKRTKASLKFRYFTDAEV